MKTLLRSAAIRKENVTLFEKTAERISKVFEENSKHPFVLRLEDGTAASIAALLISPSVSHGVRTAYFHVNDTGNPKIILDACVYVVQGVTNLESALYDALYALNYELKTVTVTGVKADLNFSDITLECCMTAMSSNNGVDIAVMTMLHDLEIALDVCGRYPILFAYSNEDLFGAKAVEASSENPSIDRPRYLRRTFQNRKRRRIIMAKARHQRSKKSPLAPDLPDIELGKDTT